MASAASTWSVQSAVRSIGLALAFTAAAVVMLLWLSGTFHSKVALAGKPGQAAAQGTPVPPGARLAAVEVRRLPAIEEASGAISPVTEAAVASRLLARVLEVQVTAGQKVKKDQVLVTLDDQDLKARLKQAQAQARAAEAAREQAQTEFDRIKGLFGQGNAGKLELDRATTALRTAEAQLEQVRQAVNEATVNLDFTVIKSPMDGTVIKRLVDPGSGVSPGQPVVVIYDRLQLEARVRESLKHRVWLNQPVMVRIDALPQACQATISEIVPESAPGSRSFTVKVTGPCPEGVIPRMFGRLLIPLDDEEVLVIPQAAVRQEGQVSLVEVREGPWLVRRSVQLGRKFPASEVTRTPAQAEVLSGLKPGDWVALPDQGAAEP